MLCNIVLSIIGLALLRMTSAQKNFRGSECPSTVKVVENFDVQKYMGTWYENAKYPDLFELGGKCVTDKYSLQANGIVNVTKSMIMQNTGVPKAIGGYAKPIDNAKLLVTYPVSVYYNATLNYWVLDTDYTSYSVVYACQPVPGRQHAINVWILTRARTPSSDLVDNAKTILMVNDVSVKELENTVQIDCKLRST